MHALPLIGLIGAYRTKGIGLNVSRLVLFPILGMLVGLYLTGANGDPLWMIPVYGALFALGSIPAHDSFFGQSVNGEWSGQAGNPIIDAIVYRLMPVRPLPEPVSYVKWRGMLGLFLVTLAFVPLYVAFDTSWAGLSRGVAFAAWVAVAYRISKPIIDRITGNKPWPDAYTQSAEWAIATGMMILLVASFKKVGALIFPY